MSGARSPRTFIPAQCETLEKSTSLIQRQKLRTGHSVLVSPLKPANQGKGTRREGKDVRSRPGERPEPCPPAPPLFFIIDWGWIIRYGSRELLGSAAYSNLVVKESRDLGTIQLFVCVVRRLIGVQIDDLQAGHCSFKVRRSCDGLVVGGVGLANLLQSHIKVGETPRVGGK